MQTSQETKGKRFFSIKWRFAIIFGGLLFVSLTLHFSTFYWVFTSHSKKELKNRAQMIAQSVAASGAGPVLSGNLGVYNKLIFDYLKLDKDIAYIITELAGNTMIVHNLTDGFPDKMFGAPFETENREGISAIRFIPTAQTGIWEAKIPFIQASSYLRVGMADARAQQAIQKSQLLLGCLMLATILIGIAISFLFSRQLTRPLISLSHAADQISTGNIEAQITVPGFNDEIRVLADSFERMRNSFTIAMRLLR